MTLGLSLLATPTSFITAISRSLDGRRSITKCCTMQRARQPKPLGAAAAADPRVEADVPVIRTIRA